MKSIGLIELQSVAAAVDALDVMLKAADVRFVTWEKKMGGRLVTVAVTGEVSAVSAAVEAAKAKSIMPIVASTVLANPHEETVRILELSASRLKKD